MIFVDRNSLDRINVLALNSCNINSWESIELLSTLLPNIEELYLAGNNFSDMPYYRQSSVSDDKSLNQTDDFVIVNAEGLIRTCNSGILFS